MRYALSAEGKAALAGRGFLPADVLVGGDEQAVPASLQLLISGRFTP